MIAFANFFIGEAIFMRYKLSVIVILASSFLFNLSPSAQSNGSSIDKTSVRQVAITIDDLPFVSASPLDEVTLRHLTAKLLKAATSNGVPVTGFVNENKLEREGKLDPSRVDLLRMWLDAGLDLGNHTFSHIDFNKTPLEEFEQDVIRGETVTKHLLADKGKQLRYFRHPFLHTGKDLETKKAFEDFLAERGYTIAPVTVDTSDWIFARAYDKAALNGDAKTMKSIGDAYIPYMDQKFAYYESQSNKLLGSEIRQILLIHANTLNADHLGDLIEILKRRGYRFISLEEALKDDAYKTPDTFISSAGISWLHRWAYVKGHRGEYFKGEPTVPEFVMKLAGVTSE